MLGIEEIVFDAAAVFAIGIEDRGPPAAAGGGRPLGNKGASMIKPSQPPWQAMEMRPPLWWLRHHLYPKGSVSLDSQVAIAPLRIVFPCHPAGGGTTTRFQHSATLTLQINIERLYSPPYSGGGESGAAG